VPPVVLLRVKASLERHLQLIRVDPLGGAYLRG